MLLPKTTMAVAFFIDGSLVCVLLLVLGALVSQIEAVAESTGRWATVQR